MDDIEVFLNDPSKADVYFVEMKFDLTPLITEAKKSGFRVININGRNIYNKWDFFKQFAREMNFPSYFGENWDAFDECIRDLAWINAKGYLIIYEYVGLFERNESPEFEKAIKIFRWAVDDWKKAGILMFICLKNDDDLSGQFALANLADYLNARK